ncbi:MAG TPA: response regulator transcription factor [Phycicoccus sp.]|jgi:DNA-binding NarL/FixJ family response regulator|nr:response regulator transcription factor [Phycicoccus sp.]HQH06268.1 response regulator transcription factor [Phycicoccus sp.]HQK32437.1 response regulator transcription factor [Phycicoccus sp.]
MSEAAEGPNATIRVLLADDQTMVRSGFAMMLSVEDDITVVGEAANGSLALDQARALRPDIVLMDVQMPVMDGIEATRVIVAEDLAKVLILTTFDRDDYVFDGLEAGASGFLLKNAGPEQLVEAIRAVAHGHALLAPEVTRRVIAAMTAPSPGAGGGRDGGRAAGRTAGEAEGLARLTEREREVLVLIAKGMSNGEIAKELFLGEATVKTHVSNTLAKLHLRDRVQAVVFAYENGLAQS